jgi:hypothetical protein
MKRKILRTNKAVSLEELDADYDRVKKLISKVPVKSDIQKYGKHSWIQYWRKYGSFYRYKVLRGDRGPRPNDIPFNDLFRNYLAVKKKLGRIPYMSEVQALGKYKSPISYNQYGGYLGFLKKIKEDTYADLVIAEYFRIKGKLGRNPSGTEYSVMGKYKRNSVAGHFGSWYKFLKYIGEEKTGYRIGQGGKKKKQNSSQKKRIPSVRKPKHHGTGRAQSIRMRK